MKTRRRICETSTKYTTMGCNIYAPLLKIA